MIGGQVSYRPLRCSSLGVQMYHISIQNKIRYNVKAQLPLAMNGSCAFLHLTASYRLTSVRIHDKLYIVSCEPKGGQTMSVKHTTPAQHKSNLRNVYGTFAIEGMSISKDTRSNLDRIGSGQASYQQVVNELRAKYAHRTHYPL